MPAVPARSAELPRSGIRVVMDLAWASPEPVLRLEVGQPDVAPPGHVLEAMRESIARGETGYTPNAGLPELRRACADKLERVNGIRCVPEQVMISAGSMQGLAAAVLGLLEPGEEILIPDPGWPNYAMIARLAGLRAVPYPLRPENGYRPDPEEIAGLVGDRTRMVVLNSPSNPLGVTWSASEQRRWLELAERNDLWVLSDECYDEIYFEQAPPSPAALDGGDRVVTVHSFSKTYAMTGLRVGYVCGPPQVMKTLVTMQEALVACVNRPAQEGARAALEGPQEFVSDMRARYRQRRDRALVTAEELGLPHVVPGGAFYLWLPLGARIGGTMAFCRRLVADHQVALAPGETFGTLGAGAVRLSLAADIATIEEGLRRVAHAL